MLIVVSPAMAEDIYIDRTGNDRNDGSKTRPFASLAAAQLKARVFARKEPVTIHVGDGVYYLPETLVFSSPDSGTRKHPVTYQAENEGKAILSGGSLLNLSWVPHDDGVFKARTPAGLKVDQLFVDGQNQRMARYPNFDASRKTDAYQGFAADAFSAERASRWANPTGGYIHAMHRARWGGYHYRITGKDANGEVTYEGGWQNNRQMGMHKDFRMVENIFEELDAPGEWFHDSSKKTLYFCPDPAVELDSARIEVVRLRHLIEFRGTESEPVSFVTLKGFTIRHAARTFMETKEPMLRSDWTIYRGGAVFLTGTEDVRILDTEFDQVGGNAVFASNYNRRLLVQGCHIHDAGASGVCFVGDPNAVRDPLFQYGQKNDLTKIDRTPGPKTNNFPADCSVKDCLIHGIGRVERQPAGVQIAMAMEITVSDSTIYDCARAGINIGDGCWGGHLIERCDVFDTVLETHDHGSFNSWGRDRYWSKDRAASQVAVDDAPELPFLDAVKTTVIRDSRWRCDHGWDIDLDDGSSNYEIYNNLMLQGGLKLREGFRRKAWNNIAVNNGLHAHVWYNDSGDEVFNNILMAAPQCARIPTEKAKGKRIDNNFFFSKTPAMKGRYVQFGWDVNSVVADPGFVDPGNGDFRLRPDSPVLKAGYKNISMNQFGVKKPSLKAIARRPVIPALNIKTVLSKPRRDSGKVARQTQTYWLEAEVSDLRGAEFSAYGVSPTDGGVALIDVPKFSDSEEAGLAAGDLIQNLNGTRIRNIRELFQGYLSAGQAPLNLKVVRNQEIQALVVDKGRYVLFESAASAAGLGKIKIPQISSGEVASSQKTRNDPLDVLVDGQLSDGYGPVYANGISDGCYRIDLGGIKKVTAVNSWSFNKGGTRGGQKVLIYGSAAKVNPGWDVTNRKKFVPLGSLDTNGQKIDEYNAVSLRARNSDTLGKFRWIIWKVSPANQQGENTAFQELAVETAE